MSEQRNESRLIAPQWPQVCSCAGSHKPPKACLGPFPALPARAALQRGSSAYSPCAIVTPVTGSIINTWPVCALCCTHAHFCSFPVALSWAIRSLQHRLSPCHWLVWFLKICFYSKPPPTIPPSSYSTIMGMRSFMNLLRMQAFEGHIWAPRRWPLEPNLVL